jgi:hypothetical protein
MLIRSLKKMEEIVERDRSLMWDGWTVVNSYPSKKGSTSQYGAYVKGEWHLQRRFEPTEAGWDIPERFIKQK